MSRTVFVNGEFVPFERASLPIMDRGFLFGDGIYEVTAAIDGRFVDADPHLARLDRSLTEIGIPNPHTAAQWMAIQSELAIRNDLREGLVYIEVTRGVFERDFLCPENLTPTVVMFTQPKTILDAPIGRDGAKVVTVPDQRWERRDIKSVSLLAQVLAKQAARRAGVSEAWMVEDGFVTEGASSTAFILTGDGRIVSRPLGHAVLPGITRQSVLRLVAERGIAFDERPFTVAEAHAASEAFYTSASSLVTPVIAIDGKPVGDGKPGPVARELRRIYVEIARSGAPIRMARAG